jgi:two-component system, chemotaxis family, chemotaxis protein CheY
MRAMVVDDSRAMRTIIGRILKEIGYEVAEAGNGEEALVVLRSGPPVEVVLVDWNMPVMNGFELVQAVRADAGWSGIRLMMVTTEADQHNIQAALQAGANEYLMKPFTKEAVLEKLSMLGIGPG